MHSASLFDGLTHYLLLLKECVVEVVARDLAVHRVERTTVEAAIRARACRIDRSSGMCERRPSEHLSDAVARPAKSECLQPPGFCLRERKMRRSLWWHHSSALARALVCGFEGRESTSAED